MLPAIERAGLLVSDIEILHLHCAKTLKAWRERFMAHRDEAIQLYEEHFADVGILSGFVENVVPQAEP